METFPKLFHTITLIRVNRPVEFGRDRAIHATGNDSGASVGKVGPCHTATGATDHVRSTWPTSRGPPESRWQPPHVRSTTFLESRRHPRAGPLGRPGARLRRLPGRVDALGPRHAAGGSRRPAPGPWFFGEVLESIESVLRASHLDVMLYRVGEGEDRETFFRELPARRKVDGLLVVGIPVNEVEQGRWG